MGELNPIYASHEALHLHFESALTREIDSHFYNLSTHFPWLGMRTNDSPAHIEYLRGIENPIAIKIGPGISPSGLTHLIQTLNPENSPGKITLVHRIGVELIDKLLPPLIHEIQLQKQSVSWCVDPMHGNTEKTSSGIKTRRVDNIITEMEIAQHIHKRFGSILSGLHLEVTHESVTECIGHGVEESDLLENYQSFIDPRLNYEQSLAVCRSFV